MFIDCIRLDESPVEPFIVALEDVDCHVQERAVDILGKIGDNESLSYLKIVLDDENVRERATAILEDLQIIDSPKKETKTQEEHQRLKETIERVGSDKTIKILIEALEDEDAETRHRAAEVLGEIGDKQAVEPLIVALNDSNSSIQWRASEALEKLKEPAVLPIITALDNGDDNVRSKSVWALGEIGDERAILPLIEHLGDKNQTVRWKSSLALGKFGKKALNPLKDALSNEDATIREKTARNTWRNWRSACIGLSKNCSN